MKGYLTKLIEDLTNQVNEFEEKEKLMKQLEEKYNALDGINQIFISNNYQLIHENWEDVKHVLTENGFDENRLGELYLLVSLKLASALGTGIELTKEQQEGLDFYESSMAAKDDELLRNYVEKEDALKTYRNQNDKNKATLERVDEWLIKYKTKSAPLDDSELIQLISNDKNISDTDRYAILYSLLKFNENVYGNHLLISEETVISTLKDYGYDLSKVKNLDEHVSKIAKTYSEEQLKEILSYVASNPEIYFDAPVLLKILYNGTDVNTIEKTYTYLKEKKIEFKTACSIVEFWTIGYNLEFKNKKVVSRRDRKPHSKPDETKNKVNYAFINGNQVRQNIDFLTEIGLFRADLKGINSIILRTPGLLERNYRACQLYKFKKIYPTSLNSSNAAYGCDGLIELNHYRYLRKYPACIGNVSKLFFAKIKYCQLKGIEYYNDVLDGFKVAISKNNSFDYDYYEEAGGFEEPEIENRDAIDDYLGNRELITIDKSLFNNPVVASLESLRTEGKRSEFEYDFDGVIVSRIKVLRILNELVDSPFDIKDSLAYATFYESIRTGDEIATIKNKLNEVLAMSKGEVK